MALIYQILSISKTSEALPAIFDNEATSKPTEMWRNTAHTVHQQHHMYTTIRYIHFIIHKPICMHAGMDNVHVYECRAVRVLMPGHLHPC